MVKAVIDLTTMDFLEAKFSNPILVNRKQLCGWVQGGLLVTYALGTFVTRGRVVRRYPKKKQTSFKEINSTALYCKQLKLMNRVNVA